MAKTPATLTFVGKLGDAYPACVATLTSASEDAWSIVGAAVYFNIYADDGTKLRDKGVCAILDATAKKVSYQPTVSDRSLAGSFRCEFVVVFDPIADPTLQESFPNDGTEGRFVVNPRP